MGRPTVLWDGAGEHDLHSLPLPLGLGIEAPRPREGDRGGWEVEIGFGKARFLLRSAVARPATRFLGIEVASKYYRLARDRAARKALANLTLIRGEAIYLMSTCLPAGFAQAVHVYHPDPWPKDKHHKRRLFDPETVDLVLGLLRPGGRLFFGTDFLEYGALVTDLLQAHPDLDVESLPEGWPAGPRTNYEAKFVALGQPIVRLIATRRPGEPEARGDLLHPAGRSGVTVAARDGA